MSKDLTQSKTNLNFPLRIQSIKFSYGPRNRPLAGKLPANDKRADSR